MPNERVVEFDARGDRSELTSRRSVFLRVRQLKFDFTTRGRPEHDIGANFVVVDRIRIKPQHLEHAQRTGGQAVAAAFVARERGFVDHQNIFSAGDECQGGRDSRRSGADDQDIAFVLDRCSRNSVDHEPQARVFADESVV